MIHLRYGENWNKPQLGKLRSYEGDDDYLEANSGYYRTEYVDKYHIVDKYTIPYPDTHLIVEKMQNEKISAKIRKKFKISTLRIFLELKVGKLSI